jgi:hypothetical protein
MSFCCDSFQAEVVDTRILKDTVPESLQRRLEAAKLLLAKIPPPQTEIRTGWVESERQPANPFDPY